MTITHEEWMEELARISLKHDEGLTTKEWAKRMGVSPRIATLRLIAAKELGWIKVGTRHIVRLDGYKTPVPVYLIVKPAKAKKTATEPSSGDHS